MESVRSRTVDDKYWQIRAKAGEITPQPRSDAQQAKNHNRLIFQATEFFLDLP